MVLINMEKGVTLRARTPRQQELDAENIGQNI